MFCCSCTLSCFNLLVVYFVAARSGVDLSYRAGRLKCFCMFVQKCNNNGNCHCEVGWFPPFCKDFGNGGGGSIDGGPQLRE